MTIATFTGAWPPLSLDNSTEVDNQAGTNQFGKIGAAIPFRIQDFLLVGMNCHTDATSKSDSRVRPVFVQSIENLNVPPSHRPSIDLLRPSINSGEFSPGISTKFACGINPKESTLFDVASLEPFNPLWTFREWTKSNFATMSSDSAAMAPEFIADLFVSVVKRMKPAKFVIILMSELPSLSNQTEVLDLIAD